MSDQKTPPKSFAAVQESMHKQGWMGEPSHATSPNQPFIVINPVASVAFKRVVSEAKKSARKG